MTTLRRLGAVVIAGMCLLIAPATAALADPPGNNGTVKVDAVEFDTHPNNEPKVGCIFQIDFYNYEEGDLHATYSFDLIPPTAGPSTGETSVFIGEDPAGGGTDLDAQETVDLSSFLAGSGVSPKNGAYHVKLTVHAEGSQGADVKHKVFKVLGCGPQGSEEVIPLGGDITVEDVQGQTTSAFQAAGRSPSGSQLAGIVVAMFAASVVLRKLVVRRIGHKQS